MGIKCIGDILRLEEVVEYLRHQKKLKESQCVLWESDEYRKNTCVELVSKSMCCKSMCNGYDVV